MSLAIFPDQLKGLTYTVVRQTEMRTLIQASPSMIEERVQQAQNPVYHWTLIYEWLWNDQLAIANTKPYAPWSDYEELVGFWLARAGQFDNFLFRDTTDRQNGLIAYVGPAIEVSGMTVPAWSTTGGSVADGSFIWTDQGVKPSSWAALTGYAKGAEIVDSGNHVQKVTSASGTSGPTAPPWNHTGSNTTDGSLNWQDQGLIGQWSPLAGFILGSLILDANNHIQMVTAADGLAVPRVPPNGIYPNYLLASTGTPNLYGTMGFRPAQLQLLYGGNGQYYSPLQVNRGGQFLDDVTDIDGPLIVYANGVLKEFQVDYNLVGPGLSLPGFSTNALCIVWNYVQPWAASTTYSYGAKTFDPLGHVQELIGGVSGNTTPTWNDSGGATPGDGSLLWQDLGAEPGGWEALTDYNPRATIVDPSNHLQMVISNVAGQSGSGTPSWNDSGGITLDGTLQWQDQGLIVTWAATTAFAVGSLILDASSHVQEVSGTANATSGASAPSWNDDGGTTTDNTCLWQDEGVPGEGGQNPPAPVTAPITAQFNYFHRVRFESDQQDWEQFMAELWTIGGEGAKQGTGYLKLRSDKASATNPGQTAPPIPKTPPGLAWAILPTWATATPANEVGFASLSGYVELDYARGSGESFTEAPTVTINASAIGSIAAKRWRQLWCWINYQHKTGTTSGSVPDATLGSVYLSTPHAIATAPPNPNGSWSFGFSNISGDLTAASLALVYPNNLNQPWAGSPPATVTLVEQASVPVIGKMVSSSGQVGCTFLLLYQTTEIGSWVSTATFNLGDQIIDSNGHIQQVFSVGTWPPGTTSASSAYLEPTWNHTGGYTGDGALTWKDMGLA